MPRDYHRLAAPAVFCSSVSRSFRRRSPPLQRHSPLRNVSSRQRERLPEDRECEYDDYAAEIASYNRLRRGDQNAVSSATSSSRRTRESYYDDSTTVVAPQSNTYYYTSHVDTDDRLHVGVPTHRTSDVYVSDDANLRGISRLDYDDRQHRKHRKKRRHHHCHSRSTVGKRSENGSSDRPPRDTIAALKALANYDDVDNHRASSVKSAHHCDSPRKFQQKESSEGKSPAASCNTAGETITVTVNASSLPVVDSSKDNLSLGECSDDDDDDDGGGGESVDTHTMQTSLQSKSSPHVTDSVHSDRASSSISNCVTTAVSFGESSKTVYSDSTAHLTDDSSTRVHHTSHTSCIPIATASTESKADEEQVPTKHDRNTADDSESQSAVQLKLTPDNKQTSAVDDENNKVSDEKRDTQHRSQSFRARRNYRKKSATDDERQTDVDDAPLPRFVVHFCS